MNNILSQLFLGLVASIPSSFLIYYFLVITPRNYKIEIQLEKQKTIDEFTRLVDILEDYKEDFESGNIKVTNSQTEKYYRHQINVLIDKLKTEINERKQK